MRNGRRTRHLIAATAALSSVMALAACSNDEGSSSADPGDDGITVRGCDPQTALIPSATNSPCGLNVLNAITARLVHYADDGDVTNDLAEAIKTSDSKTFTVTLKERNFSDGTRVTASSFVDAWNWAAYGPHNQVNAVHFAKIAGYPDVHPEDPDGEQGLQQAPAPRSTTMSGLKVIDDRTFTITLSGADSSFPQRLGMVTFAPLPTTFFTDDGEEFAREPIGAGPFKFESYDRGESLVLSADEEYTGNQKPHVKKVVFRMYSDVESAYNDVVANALDVTDVIPAAARQDERYRDDLDDRWVASPRGQMQYLRFPDEREDDTYDDNRLRRALSMALDRTELVKLVSADFLVPATGWVPPGVGGHEANRCGSTCLHDASEADDLRDNAGGYDGVIRITYNTQDPSTPSGEMWERVCQDIEDAISEPCELNPLGALAYQRAAQDENTRDLIVVNRSMGYPSIRDFLIAMYSRTGPENINDFLSARVNAALATAATRPSVDAGNDSFQNAEERLVDNMPSIPLWYVNTVGGYSERVENVKFDAFGLYDLASIAVTD